MPGSFNFDEGGAGGGGGGWWWEILGNFSSDFSSAVFVPQTVNFCMFLSSTCLQGSSWFLLFTSILINLLSDGFPNDAVDYRWHRNGVFIARHTMAQFTVIASQVSSRVLKFDVGTFLLSNFHFHLSFNALVLASLLSVSDSRIRCL